MNTNWKRNGIFAVTVMLVALVAGATGGAGFTSLDLAKQLNQAFIEVADAVSPSVVVIDVTQTVAGAAFEEGSSPWDMMPPGLRRQFRRQFEEQMPEKVRGQGSGVIIRKDGYILTNRHVVEDAEKIEVRLQDGRRFKAVVRGQDPQSDVAVLKIEATNLPAATLGNSAQTRVGEFAIAIGAPFNLDYSVTFGHVSAKGRGGVVYDPFMDQEFIQTDANINPGNSGGPLVNINGEVIGINTLIRGLRTGIGFAIPIDLAKEVADQLVAEGKFTRAWLGIGIATYSEVGDIGGLIKGVTEGVVVRSIQPEGPAAKSELRPVDVITAVDGKAVRTVQQLKSEVRHKKIGQPVTLDVVRQGKPMKVKVLAAERNAAGEVETRPVFAREEEEVDASGLGLEVRQLTHELADQFDAPMIPGVIVTAVAAGSPADRAQIKPGSIITDLGQQPVTSPKEFAAALKNVNLRKGVIVNYISGKTRRFEILKARDE